MCFDISFRTIKDKKKFEKRFPIQTKNVLVGEKSDSGGFIAWQLMRNPSLDIVYFAGFIGYGDPSEIVRQCKVAKIGIKFFAFIPINDKNSKWHKEIGKW